MKTAWLTDIHFEFLKSPAVEDLFQALSASSADAILVSGDIATADSVADRLLELARRVAVPIYFVLGNHDFYHGSIRGVRARIRELCESEYFLHWLNLSGIVSLGDKTCLVGHDGWGDGRLGNFLHTPVYLNDFRLIDELSGLEKEQLFPVLNQLGDEAADHLRELLPEALDHAEHVVVLTHVPPFREAAWHEGEYSSANWLPFFACKAVGDVLVEFMTKYESRSMTVLCGHTHGGGTSQILPNLKTITGPSEYGKPVLQNVFEWL